MSGPGRAALTGGSLRLRAVLERPVETDDGAGGATVSWVAESAFWVERATTAMNEAEIASGIRDRTAVRLRFRERSDVTPEKRLRIDDHIYTILAVGPPDKRGGWMTAICEERA